MYKKVLIASFSLLAVVSCAEKESTEAKAPEVAPIEVVEELIEETPNDVAIIGNWVHTDEDGVEYRMSFDGKKVSSDDGYPPADYIINGNVIIMTFEGQETESTILSLDDHELVLETYGSSMIYTR